MESAVISCDSPLHLSMETLQERSWTSTVYGIHVTICGILGRQRPLWKKGITAVNRSIQQQPQSIRRVELRGDESYWRREGFHLYHRQEGRAEGGMLPRAWLMKGPVTDAKPDGLPSFASSSFLLRFPDLHCPGRGADEMIIRYFISF